MLQNNWAKKLRRKNLKTVSTMPNGFSFNSYCYFWWTHKHAWFITKLLWNWPGDQKQAEASRHWATLNNIPAGKLQLGDCLSLWLVFSFVFLTDGCRFWGANMLRYVRQKAHPSAVYSIAGHSRLSMVETLLALLFLTEIAVSWEQDWLSLC